MKQIGLLFIMSLFWVACQNNPDPKTNETPPALETNKAGTSTELNQGNETAPNPMPAEAKPSDPEEAKAHITGSNVTMRKEASVQSEKLGSFESGEAVEVLETKNVNNDREAILSKPITVKGSGGEVNLPKGKAVVIEEYQSERNFYLVTYQDPQKGKLTAEVDASAVETITYSTWYKVKRNNGETGWVLGKFLKIN